MVKLEQVSSSGLAYRWVILVLYILLAAAQQISITGLAPLLPEIQQRYGLSELLAGTCISIIPFCWLISGLHSGSAIDRWGHRRAVLTGVSLLVLGTWLRTLDAGFVPLLAGQAAIGLSQPYVVNSISKIAVDWFPSSQAATATGLCGFGVLIGATLGFWIMPLLAAQQGFFETMLLTAVVTSVIAACYTLFVRERQNLRLATDIGLFREMKSCLKHREIIYLSLVSFCFVGSMNGITTWYALIMAPHNFTAEDAGLVAGIICATGAIGTVVAPLLSDYFKQRKIFIWGPYLLVAALVYPLCATDSLEAAKWLGALIGIFWMGPWAIVMIMSEEVVGRTQAGMAMGVVMLAGMAGMFLTVYGMPLVKVGDNWYNAVMLAIVELVLIPIFMFKISETYSRGIPCMEIKVE